MRARLPTALLGAAIQLLLWPGTTWAETWIVAADGSGDFEHLADACEAAASGDTINIMPGNYVEEGHDQWGEPPLRITGKSLFLQGLGDEPASISIKARMWLQGASVVMRSLSFRNTSDPFWIEGGSAAFETCVFEDNHGADGLGGAVDCYGAVVTISGCTFSRNADGQGGAICSRESDMLIRNCLFTDNEATESGGAIYASWGATIEGSVLCGNAAPDGAALDIGGECVLRECTVWGNLATNYGGSLLLSWNATIERTIIGGTVGGSALSCEADGAFSCCAFWGDEREIGGGFWDCFLIDYLEADPLFCDPENRDFGLKEGSPCLPGGYDSCARIGARDLGCGVDAVPKTSWGKLKSLFR